MHVYIGLVFAALGVGFCIGCVCEGIYFTRKVDDIRERLDEIQRSQMAQAIDTRLGERGR